jgi:glutathione S-transferase
MRPTLHVINGSHPCAAVLRAMELKGIDVKLVEYIPPTHAPLLQLRFKVRRLPVLVLESGEVIAGSRRIMQRLDAMQPYPQLYPPEQIAAIEEAERWGDEILQTAARRILWIGIKYSPGSLASFSAGSKLPSVPGFLTTLIAPLVVAGESRLNGITEERVRGDLRSLPGLLDRLAEFEASGAFGTTTPTGADLQIGASLQLLRSFDDLRPLIDSHPQAREIARWLPTSPGRIPAGALPPEMLQLVVA